MDIMTRKGTKWSMLRRLRFEIEKRRTLLIAQLEKGIIYENFGTTEEQEIDDIVNPLDFYGHKDSEALFGLRAEFSDWCGWASPHKYQS
jgi:hypothetical protein